MSKRHLTSRTVKALVARKVPTNLAIDLEARGFDLKSLAKESENELRERGLSFESILLIHKVRPPIPSSVVTSLLFKSRMTCCVCRDHKKGVILHHIEAWHESRNHSEANIVALCLDHHGEAHTKRDLSQNLTPEVLQSSKKQWEDTVKINDVRAIQDAVRSVDMGHPWFFVNHPRIFEMAVSNGIDLKKNRSFRSMRRVDLVNEYGIPTWSRLEALDHAYMHGDCMIQYDYVSETLDRLLGKLRFYNMSDFLRADLAKVAIRESDIIFVQGRWMFGEGETVGAIGNSRKVWRKVGDVSIHAEFDDWHATSTSAWGVWLRQTQSMGCLLKVRSVFSESDHFRVFATLLGVAHGLQSTKSHSYGNFG